MSDPLNIFAVDDLRSLEKVMLAVERIIKEGQDDPRFQGMRILRKENKFIANDGKADPYRAVQYTITFPGKDGEQFTFELQLKTFSAMVASDLFHNAVYKSEILNLPGDLQQTVRDYNWQSDVEETKAYLGEEAARGVRAQELSFEQRVGKAIEERDFSAFYDLVLSKIEAGRNSRAFTDKAEWIKTYDWVNKMLDREVEFLNQLKETRPDIIQALARASHDNGYYKTKDVAGEDGRGGIINDPASTWLKPELSSEAINLLTEAGRRSYNGRYENFRGNNQKLSVGQLDLYNLSPEVLRAFFEAVGKDPEAPGVKRLIQDIESLRGASSEQLASKEAKKILNRPIINLYHQSFDDLLARGKAIVNSEARSKWNEAIINNQIKAVAVSVLLTEVGGVDENGQTRDLGRSASENVSFTLREKLIHEFWVFALQYNGEFAFDGLDRFGNKDSEGWRTADPEGRAAMNYERFVTTIDDLGNLSFANQINLDRTLDVAIMQEVVKIHLRSIAEKIAENRENPIKIAGLQRARAEILAKYIKAVVNDRHLSDNLVEYIDAKFNQDSETLLRGNGGAMEMLQKIIGLADRSQSQRESFQKDLMRDNNISGMSVRQRNIVDLIIPTINVADFNHEEFKDLIKIIVGSSSPLTANQIKRISGLLPVVADLREKLQTASGMVLYGAGGTGKSEQLDIALGISGRSQDMELFDLREEFLAGRAELKNAYKTSAELKQQELLWLRENMANIEERLINSKKGIVVFDEFDLAIGQVLNDVELSTANLVFDLANRLQQKGMKVILIVHYKGIKTQGFLGALRLRNLIADNQSLVQTRYLPSSIEDELLTAMGIENSAVNNSALSRFKALTQGLPAAYLGFMKYAVEFLKNGGQAQSFRPSFVELVGQAYREIEKNYRVLKVTGNPEIAILLQELAKGKISLSDGSILAQREELLATGLIGEKDGVAGSELVMAPLVSDVINLMEANEQIKGLPKEYAGYLDIPHFHTDFHNEGGREATLKDHLWAQFAVLKTALENENIPPKAREFLREWLNKNRSMVEAFILFHDMGKVTHNTLKADGVSHSFQGLEQASFDLLNSNSIYYGDFDVSTSTLLKLIIKNHIFAFTVNGKKDIENLSKEFVEQGIVGDDFTEAMKLLIATTTLDLLSAQMDEYGNSGQMYIIERMIQAFEDFQATKIMGSEGGLPGSSPVAIQTQDAMRQRINESTPRHGFIKDAPILAWRITSTSFEDIPEVIRRHIGEVDKTKYSQEYLATNLGSVLALQMNGDKPDFYIIGKDTFDKKYKVVPASEVETKNKKVFTKLQGVEGMVALISSGDEHLVGALKTVPVQMVQMSEIGYPVAVAVTIQSPWGEQTKPADKDAYLVFDESQNQYYMVNTDDAGNPLSYVPASSPIMGSEGSFTGGLQTQEMMRQRISEGTPRHGFIKDAPILGWQITSISFDDIPYIIRRHLGEVDRTKYTEEYLATNMGSILALQMNGDKPDFYIIGKDTFDKKYKVVPAGEVAVKNKKVFTKLQGVEGMAELISSGNEHLVGALKTIPVQMVRMSEIGYPVESEVTIQSPWGEQTKPAGQDAYLVFDDSQNQYYMVNTDKGGNPLSYVPASSPVMGSEGDFSQTQRDPVKALRDSGKYDELLDTGRFRFESIQTVDTKNLEAAIRTISQLGNTSDPEILFEILNLINTETNLKRYAAVTGFEALRGLALAKFTEKQQGKLPGNYLEGPGFITAFRTWVILGDMGAMIDLSRASQEPTKIFGSEGNIPFGPSTGQTGDKLGGIDFRTMNILVQPMGNFSGLDFTLPKLNNLTNINLDEEFGQIQNMVAGGIIPSGMRIKELIAACSQKKEIISRADEMIICLTDIFRLEEESLTESSPELKEAIVILDSNRFVLQ